MADDGEVTAPPPLACGLNHGPADACRTEPLVSAEARGALPDVSALRVGRDQESLRRLWRPPGSHALHGLDPDSHVLLLSLQSTSAYNQLRRHGALTGPAWEQVSSELRPAYEWMAGRLAHRLWASAEPAPEPGSVGRHGNPARCVGAPKSGRFAPLWAWAQVDLERVWSDHLAHRETRGSTVAVVFAAQVKAVVFSAHDAWHHALNRTWCPAPNHNSLDPDDALAYENFLAEADSVMGGSGWSFEDLPEPLQLKVEASWRWGLIPALFATSPVQVAVHRLDAAQVTGALVLP